MSQKKNTLDYLYESVNQLKNSCEVDSSVFESLDCVLRLIKGAEGTFKAEIELAKLVGRNELLKELVNNKQLN